MVLRPSYDITSNWGEKILISRHRDLSIWVIRHESVQRLLINSNG